MTKIKIDTMTANKCEIMIFGRDSESIELGYAPFAIYEKGKDEEVGTADTLYQAVDIAITWARRKNSI